MLKLSYCEIRVSRPRDVAAGVTTIEEGVGLMAVREQGITKVKPSTGAANTDEFAGFAMNERTAPSLFPMVFQGKVVLLSAGKWGFNLPKAPVGTPRVTYDATGAVIPVYTADSDSVLEVDEYKITGTVFETTVDALGKLINVVYNFSPTFADLQVLGGDNSPTTFSTLASLIGITGVIESGLVYTSNFDPSIDWANWTPAIGLKSVANGVITTLAGTGAIIKGRVMAAPSVDMPFLAIDFSVA